MVDYSVLIIDDDVWMQRILSKTLQSYGFKKSLLASNGFDGIALAVEYVPTLVVLDILMPELSGHLTLRILKRIKATQNIPVLMVSALSDVENLGMAVKSGTAGFISKPFTRATVYDKLLDVFGKEKLELIQRGEPIDLHSIYYHEEILTPAEINPHAEMPEYEEQEEQTQTIPDTKPKIRQDHLIQHYQEDERRSIESIKKMLLRNKK